MQISKIELDRYRTALETIKANAEDYVRKRVSSECKGLEVAQARETAIGIISMAVSLFGMQAQAVAVEFFHEIMEAGNTQASAHVFDDITDRNNIVEKVHYYARKLVDGDFSGFVDDCVRRTGFYVWREANECQVRNVEENNA